MSAASFTFVRNHTLYNIQTHCGLDDKTRVDVRPVSLLLEARPAQRMVPMRPRVPAQERRAA